MAVLRTIACLALLVALAGCGSSSRTQASTRSGAYDYDSSAKLGYVDSGAVARLRPSGFPVRDVSFRSRGDRIEGYLVLPRGGGRHPAIVVVHGAGGDRSELVAQAGRLAARGFVALTITEPSTTVQPPQQASPLVYLRALRKIQIRDVVAIRRAVDVLQSLPQVDRERIGYLGWSAGGRNGTFVAETEPRVKALALLSTGAAPLSAFVAQAPPALRAPVRRILGAVDPLRAIAHGRPNTILLEDGKRDEIVPHEALVNIANAAPRGTTVRWYDARHALNDAAYDNAFAWLAGKLEG